MKRLLVVILFLLLACTSCSGDNNTTLASMLDSIPSDPASDCTLWFTNIAQIKEKAGVQSDISMEDFLRGDMDHDLYLQRTNLLMGYTLSPFSGESYSSAWKQSFGFDAFDTTTETWGMLLSDVGQSRVLFSVMEGDFDTNKIDSKFDALSYNVKEYDSVDYYSIHDDYAADMKSPTRIAMAYLNRVMVTEHELIAAPADELFIPLLDARSGRETSLDDSAAYRHVAEVLNDVLGAALVPPSQLVSENTQSDWNALHSYDLIGIGYDSDGEKSITTIVLHYPDSSAAADDVEELARRMTDYVTAYSGSNTALTDMYEIGKPEAMDFEGDSILKVELVRKPDTGMTWDWISMVMLGELGFLVADPL